MKIKEGYKVREIAGEYIIVNQGNVGVDFTKIISMNSTAKYIYEKFVGKDFSITQVAEALVERYGINPELAMSDAEKWIAAMLKAEIID